MNKRLTWFWSLVFPLVLIIVISVHLKPLDANADTISVEPRGVAAMTDFDRLPYFKTGTTIHEVSSYDRTGGNADGSSYSFYQNPTTGGYVVLEEYHPGTIYRIWATGLQGGNIRIYFNGETTPRVDMPVTDFFSGSVSPFLFPLVGNDQESSGGFYSYYPFSFTSSVRVEFSVVPSYYQITYHLYNTSYGVTTYAGTEDMSAVLNAWNNPYSDPKDQTGNQLTSLPSINLPPGQSQTLYSTNSGGSIRSIKFQFPQFITTQYPSSPSAQITDNGRAFIGNSTFNLAIESTNSGVLLTRRLDYGIADQVANVYVDNQLVGQWSTPGSDNTNHWRNSNFTIPSSFTLGKSQINVRVQFVSSSNDWNEFYYWAYSTHSDGTQDLTDTLDVDDPTSEANHNYVITNQTWEGTRTYTYPGAVTTAYDPATVDILTHTRIQMYWDGETTPSVDVPLGYFFGVGSSGEGLVKGLLMGTDPTTHTYYNFYPMPFNQSAQIVLVNNSAQTISNASLDLQTNPTLYSGLGTTAGYFTAIYNIENPTTSGQDFHWVNIPSGTGQVVNTILNIRNGTDTAVLEGDDRLFVDQNSYNPQFNGTGTEDYFNGGWYFNQGIFTLPVHGNPLNHGLNGQQNITMYRSEIADVFPFEKSLTLNIEHGGADDLNAIYEGAVFAYMIKNQESLQLTDTLQVGDPTSEASHNYQITNQTWQGTLDAPFFGRDGADQVIYNNTGRAHQGTSTFTMAINPNNYGIRLARILDDSVGNQKANVYVDNQLAGTWFTGGSNTTTSALYDYFEIPPSLTQGKSSITIQIQFVSSNKDWNEFTYFTYAHTSIQALSATPTPTPTSPIPTISPTPSPTPTMTPIPTPTPTPLPTFLPNARITDDFNRANNSTTLGTATTGQTWSYSSTPFGIINNQAYSVNGCPAPGYAVVDGGAANGSIQVALPINRQDMRIPFRYVDANNLYWVENVGNHYVLSKMISGVRTDLAANLNVLPQDGDILKVDFSGPAMNVYINGNLIMSGSDSSLLTATKFGLGDWCSSLLRYDNFSFAPQDITNPTVSITNPANNSTVSRKTKVTISASATDNVAVASVQFYVNNTLTCTDTTSPYSCVWSVPNSSGITYTIQAKATDTSSNSATSTITVKSK